MEYSPEWFKLVHKHKGSTFKCKPFSILQIVDSVIRIYFELWLHQMHSELFEFNIETFLGTRNLQIRTEL